jgi:raffinose/stachyose/melibiose transport system permease protein
MAQPGKWAMKPARLELYAGRTLLVVLMAITIVPFISIFTTALHPSGTVPSGLAWPADPQWGNFIEAFNVANMSVLLASSTFIVLAVVPVSLAIATMAGFAIGLLRIPGSRLLFLLFVFGLTLPFEGIIIPLYFLEQQMGILNSRFAIVLPLIGLYMPFAVFWMRAHFINMPAEVSDAARVDGASTWDLFWRIHVPLARPAIASLGILMAVWTWNQFLLSLVLVEDPLQRTMAGALGAFQGHYATDIPLLCAGTILILLPTLLIFILFQRQVIAALLEGAVRG